MFINVLTTEGIGDTCRVFKGTRVNRDFVAVVAIAVAAVFVVVSMLAKFIFYCTKYKYHYNLTIPIVAVEPGVTINAST